VYLQISARPAFAGFTVPKRTAFDGVRRTGRERFDSLLRVLQHLQSILNGRKTRVQRQRPALVLQKETLLTVYLLLPQRFNPLHHWTHLVEDHRGSSSAGRQLDFQTIRSRQ
jgi:hypothetical protein